ncbi:hypothetical protein GYMLUDRAFT_785545 [Collybiopsis luxurians FD-317 M1]|nr:hypothetical protein GYMLUDRAFT_785545 [Collybiopsis luxurians FD-317 M1]
MPAGSNGTSPSYISNHSADVILSDIRPIKLKIEGLRCINVFLDEFLYSILKAAHSLTTDKLRAGLLNVLPTPLGKEALLEAEVELRAYWDRTKPSKVGAVDDDSSTFHLQWAFELLRLKCEAYSTLNESDGDKSAESRLHERFAATGQPPRPSLVAPAALYLTAILEAMCEHVLSNVGRVASRDSSRTYASVQDVFVALCEDETVYNLFRSMEVYEQIEQLSQAPKPRRSFSRNGRPSTSNIDHSSGKDSPPIGNRLSSEGMSNRSSFDRSKSKKSFTSRSSNSHDGSANGHKRTESLLNDESKQANNSFDAEEQASLQEFDDLMKSDATMKVSLTPDRLKTMEVYKQEKTQRGGRPRPPPLLSGNNSELESSSFSKTSRRPSAPNVTAIVEDEEESAAKSSQPRARQASVASPPPKSLVAPSTRARSQSAAAPSVQRKSSKTNLPSGISSPPPASMNTREFRGTAQGFDDPGLPQKTRKVQRARESLDLDEVMAGSDDEDMMDEPVVSPSKSFASSTPSRVSNRTKELMEFLSEGPPSVGPHGYPNRPPTNTKSPAMSRAGRELMEFLNEGPPDFGPPPPMMIDNGSKSRGSGRLQRMISKLKLGEDKARNGQQNIDDFSRKTPTTPSLHRTPLAAKTSNGNLSVLGNRPVPPRPPPPQMISPPSSPARDTVDLPSTPTSSPPVTSPPAATLASVPSAVPPPSPRPRQPANGQSSVSRKAAVRDQPTPVASLPSSAQNSSTAVDKVQQLQQPVSTRLLERDREQIKAEHDLEDTKPLSPSSKTTPALPEKSEARLVAERKKTATRVTPIQTSSSERKALTPSENTTPSASGISIADALEMKRLLLKATSPEECRLIMDIYFTKVGIPVEPTEYDAPYPSPSPSDAPDLHSSALDNALEISLVELFLGGEPSTHEPTAPRKKRYTSKKVRTDTQTANHTPKPFTAATNGHAHLVHPPVSVPVSEGVA